MSWNLEKHILDHAAAVYNKLGSKRDFDPSDDSNSHFTFSIDISQMILNHDCKNQSDIDMKLKAFMDDLIMYESVNKEIKGKDKKTGERIYRDVKFNFNDDILLAYHNSGSDSINSQNYSVNPHFHVLAQKSKKLGRGYNYLNNAVKEIAEKHGLVFNNMEKTDRPKIDSQSAKDLTWFVKRASDKDFKKKFESGYLEKQLEKFQEHYKQTGNIQYLLKGYADLRARLERQQIEHNLNFSLFLNEAQKRTIETLYSGDKAKIQELLTDRSNHIARAYLEHSMGFKNIIIDEIQVRARKEIPIVELDTRRIAIKTRQKEDKKGDYSKTINFAYREDLNTAVKYARNEKELKQLMIKLGYNDFQFKAKNQNGKRQRVGFSFINKNGKLVNVYFNNIDNSMDNIRKQLQKNSENKELKVDESLHSYLKAYKPPIKSKNNDLFEKIYDLRSSVDLNNFYISEVGEHVEFKAKGTYIVDEGRKLLIKKQKREEMERNVALLVDMAQAKGWSKSDITITGSDEFKLRVELELRKREIEALQKEQTIETTKTQQEQKEEMQERNKEQTAHTQTQTHTKHKRRDYV